MFLTDARARLPVQAIVSPLDHLPLGQQEDQGQGDKELADGGPYQAQEGGFKYGDYILQKVLRVFPGLDKT